MYKAIKTLEEMPGALSYPIEKVRGAGKDRPKLAEQARRKLFTALDGCR